MRPATPFLAAVLLMSGCTAGAGSDPVDRSIVGVWQATGSTMTSSMLRTGSFLLRIAPNGDYVLVSTGTTEFVIDSGRFVDTRAGAYLRRTATGLEDRGAYDAGQQGLRLRSAYGELAATRAPANAGEPALTRVATLVRLPARQHISQWTARAAVYAALWRPDARLEYVSVTGTDERGWMTAGTNATIGFYSPGLDRFLLLSPAQGESGAMVASTSPRNGRPVSASGIPVPIVDLAILVNRQREAGQVARYAAADLRFVSDGRASPRLLWVARVADTTGLDRQCLDAATVQIVDCRAVAGDPRADLAALERRAAVAWADMQRRLSVGDATNSDLSYVPPSDFERCGWRGGTHNGVGCFGSDGAEIR